MVSTANVTVSDKTTDHKDTGDPLQSVRTFHSRKEAEDWAKAEELHVDQHLHADAGRLSLDAYLTDWLRRREQCVRPSTLAGYRKLLDLYVRPQIKRLLLRDASPQTMQSVLDTIKTTGSAAHSRRLLHAAFEDAARLGLLAFNPMDRTKTPPRQARQGTAWTLEEARRFLATAADDSYQPYWTLALCTGLRPSELLGLKWDAIDLATGTLIVRTARATVGSAVFDGDPKSAAGKRTLKLPAAVVVLLCAHQTTQKETATALRGLWHDEGIVCASAVGTPIALRNISHRFKTLCERAQVRRIRPYDLRHSAISLMSLQGHGLYAISQIAGRGDPRLTTRVYQHAYESQKSRVLADLAGDLLGDGQAFARRQLGAP